MINLVKMTAFVLAILAMNTQAEERLRAFLQAKPTPTDAVPYGNNIKAGKTVLAGDAKIYYEVYGKGVPVVILHGGGVGSTMEMAGFIDKLKQTNRVIAISTRGHGRSEIGHSPVTYDQKANDVKAVLDDAGIDSATVIGFSDGAYTGYKVASLYPSRVNKLVAIGAGEQKPGLRQVNLDLTAMESLDPGFIAQQKLLMPEPERWQEYWANLEHFYNTMVASKELFMSIQCPVLVVSGERDGNAPLATVIAAYQMIPDSQLAIIPNAGHVVFAENFAAVWASMEPFLVTD